MFLSDYLEADSFLLSASAAGITTNVKVGVDTGRGLLQIAKARPKEVFLGIEIKPDKCETAAQRLKKAGIRNAVVLNSEAQSYFARSKLQSELDCVHVYFPTPLQKTLDVGLRPAEERLMNLRFLRSIFKALVLGGELRFMTDVEDYFLYLEKGINTSRWWVSDWDEYDCGQPAGCYVGTPCEQQFRSEQRPIFAAVVQKIRKEY